MKKVKCKSCGTKMLVGNDEDMEITCRCGKRGPVWAFLLTLMLLIVGCSERGSYTSPVYFELKDQMPGDWVNPIHVTYEWDYKQEALLWEVRGRAFAKGWKSEMGK